MIKILFIFFITTAMFASEFTDENKRLCDKGNYFACIDLGIAYFTADGVEKDLKKSERLFWKACKGRVAQGCYYLGYIYKRGGKGVKQDKKKAKLAFARACNIGSEKSCEQMRMLEAKGI